MNEEETRIASSANNSSDSKAASTERAEYVYEQVNLWIENADSKVGVSCGVFSGVFGVVTFLTEQYVKTPENSVIQQCWESVYRTCFIVSLFVMVVAVLFYASAIIPSLKKIGKSKKKRYPIFYGDIAALDVCAYKRLMTKGNDETYRTELIVETWVNSRICLKKMKRYRLGVILSLIAIVTAFVSLGAHYMMYQ